MNFAQPIDFACIMEPVAIRLLGEPNLKLSNPPHDVRFGSRGSISADFVNGRYYDHETKRGGGVLDLISYKTGPNRDEAQGWLKREGLLNPPSLPDYAADCTSEAPRETTMRQGVSQPASVSTPRETPFTESNHTPNTIVSPSHALGG